MIQKKQTYYKDERDERPSPDLLINELKNEGFAVDMPKKYGDDKMHNISYVLANKKITYNNTSRTLVAVIIRGTDSEEWKGNMDVTGDSYASSMNAHYSFNAAKGDLKGELNTYLSSKGITNAVVFITGHSRGAAVANLLAEDLTAGGSSGLSGINPGNVFAYTFATPNSAKNPNTAHTNIHNFCFEDDFVPQVPLKNAWGYDKHGNLYTATAQNITNTTFKNEVKNFTKN